jgi:hypothetical protein
MQVDLDKFRFMVVRALRYYETMLIGLANNLEGVCFEPIVNRFGNYLEDWSPRELKGEKGSERKKEKKRKKGC